MAKAIDITNQRFGKLIALNYSHTVDRSHFWNFICDCGTARVLRKISVTQGLTRSCGCLSKRFFRDLTGQTVNGIKFKTLIGKNKQNCWMYEVECFCGKTFKMEANDITSGKIKSCGCKLNSNQLKNADYIKSLKKQYMSHYKVSARKRKLDFTLKFEEFDKLITSNCYYCGTPPFTIRETTKVGIKTNGIDRVNNEEGYTQQNTVSCCFLCNQAKHMMTPEYFKKWLGKVFDFKEKKEGFWKDV